mgnify:FL=1
MLAAVEARTFVWDGCHKIFLMQDTKDEQYALDRGWDLEDFRLFDRGTVEELYDSACPLRAVWWMTEDKRPDVIEQFDKDNK